MLSRCLAFAGLAFILGGCFAKADHAKTEASRVEWATTTNGRPGQSQPEQQPCPVTPPNHSLPPHEAFGPGDRYLGNGALWTELYPNPFRPRSDDLEADGSITIKVPWWRRVRGKLKIEGHELDAAARPLTAWIPTGYGRTGFQSTAVTFPTDGCWQVIGRAGQASLTFVILIRV